MVVPAHEVGATAKVEVGAEATAAWADVNEADATVIVQKAMIADGVGTGVVRADVILLTLNHRLPRVDGHGHHSPEKDPTHRDQLHLDRFPQQIIAHLQALQLPFPHIQQTCRSLLAVTTANHSINSWPRRHLWHRVWYRLLRHAHQTTTVLGPLLPLH